MQDHQLLEIFMNEDFGCQLKSNIDNESFQKYPKFPPNAQKLWLRVTNVLL